MNKMNKYTKKRNPRDKFVGKTDDEKVEMHNKRKGCNDPNWYATNPQLLKDAASIPFSWATGNAIHLNNPYISDGTLGQTRVAPGFMAFYMKPSVGLSNSPTSPINTAAASIYSFIRHANSGSANYDAPDMMQYLIAIANIYAYINYLIRIYGIARTFSSRNRYLPQALITAMGMDLNASEDRLANFRYGINLRIAKMASFAVPKNFSYFLRSAFLYSSIYTEGTSAKDQMYFYSPAGFYKFINVGSSTSVPTLQMFEFPYQTARTTDVIMEDLDTYIAPLLLSEDFGIMSGDILKAYGTEGIFKLSQIAEDYTVVPEFNIGVLEQMRNLDIVPRYLDTAGPGFSVTQNNGWLYSYNLATVSNSSAAKVGSKAWCQDRILQTTTAEVTPELVMESSRGKIAADYIPATGSSTTDNVRLITGSDYCVDALIGTFSQDSTTGDTTNWTTLRFYVDYALDQSATIADANVMTLFRLLGLAAAFKFKPPQIVIGYTEVTTGSPTVQDVNPFEDYDNYGVLSKQNIINLHQVALMSMFDVPSVAKAYQN